MGIKSIYKRVRQAITRAPQALQAVERTEAIQTSLEDAQALTEASKAQAEALETLARDRDTLQAQAESLRTEAQGKQDEITALKIALQDTKRELQRYKTIVDLSQAYKDDKPQVCPIRDGGDAEADNVLATWRKLTGDDKTAYYREHKHEIWQLTGKA